MRPSMLNRVKSNCVAGNIATWPVCGAVLRAMNAVPDVSNNG